MANFNIVVDEDQQWLLNCLSATLDPNHDVRSFAEASLNQASLQPGFGSALSKVAANRELPLGLRQISFFIIMFIKKHWHEAEEAFEHPAVSSDEKAVVRRLLLLSLDDSHRKICTAISMAVASIAAYDWPEVWPDLLPYLMKLINDQTNMNGVHGALRCLALLSVDLDDTVVPTLVPALFPCLLKIVSSPEMYDKYLRTKALSIVYSCISMLGVMSGVYKTETSALIVPMVKPWMDQFSKILNHPLQSEDPDDWSIRTEVLKCLNQFVQNFPSLIESEFMIIVGPLWQTFMTSLGVYVRSSIEGTEDPFDGRYDSDGAEKSLDSFVVQLFEFLLTIVGSAKLVKVIMNNVEELTYYTIAFLQITEQQVHTWSMDANQFVADEDDVTYSCRVSGALLLEEVVNSCGTEGISAIIEAAKKRFSESQREKDAGSPIWWRIREATLFALASLSEQLLEAEDSELTRVGSGNLLEQIITEDIGLDVHQYPFLYSRIFSSVAKFSSVISHGVLEHFLYAAIKAISMDVPPPVKVGACRALSELLPETNKVIIHPHLMSLFQSLSDLLNQASDETLHLVLETLQEAIKAGYELSASIEPIISPVVLNMWASHISDPFICIDAIEVMETLKDAPGCIRPLVSRVLPYVWSVLNKVWLPQQQPDGLVAGSVDLVTMLLKNAPIDVVKTVYDACFDTVIQIVLQSDDHSEMQNATECLAAFVSGGRQDVLAWSGDLENTMRRLLDAASRLLDPDLDSSGSLFVGSYTFLQLILHLPSQMAPHIRDLVAALIRRMQSAQIAGLRSSLLLIFARLVHLSAPKVEQFIDLLVTIPAEGYDNSFVYLMSEWTQQQGEIQGAYQIKVTTTALALLLSSRHAELAKINVQGYLFQSAAGITTRSKAKLTPDQWTVVPLPAKIMALLADALVEIQEQVVAGDNQDLMYSAGVTSSGRPSHQHLEAIAKAFNKVNFNNRFHSDSISRKHLLKVIQFLYPKKKPDAGSKECYSNGTSSVKILVDVLRKRLLTPKKGKEKKESVFQAKVAPEDVTASLWRSRF
ncbi:importin-9 isoform X1 [Prunus yedoensis var. nudiflora]|uniref:Importin-9 isoform X1 n=1 Tax=Prunus yedoensis var. nudiflora TaxID=2094558 RepID=A0A314ZLR6_PRUYE|nr:importin-9 isoform X1 [Prunus yedoensis var. nudiflora]